MPTFFSGIRVGLKNLETLCFTFLCGYGGMESVNNYQIAVKIIV